MIIKFTKRNLKKIIKDYYSFRADLTNISVTFSIQERTVEDKKEDMQNVYYSENSEMGSIITLYWKQDAKYSDKKIGTFSRNLTLQDLSDVIIASFPLYHHEVVEITSEIGEDMFGFPRVRAIIAEVKDKNMVEEKENVFVKKR